LIIAAFCICAKGVWHCHSFGGFAKICLVFSAYHQYIDQRISIYEVLAIVNQQSTNRKPRRLKGEGCASCKDQPMTTVEKPAEPSV
jgi:hypothetical protein